jgi:hypothetical protein
MDERMVGCADRSAVILGLVSRICCPERAAIVKSNAVGPRDKPEDDDKVETWTR